MFWKFFWPTATVIAALTLVAPFVAHAETEWPNGISLGCTPIPVANAKPDKNPSVRVNLDIAFANADNKLYDTPRFSVLHFLADGKRADRWAQYQYESFKYFPSTEDKPSNFIFIGVLKGHSQVIGMSLWAPMKNAANQVWMYQEYIGTNNNDAKPKLVMTARCYEEGAHQHKN